MMIHHNQKITIKSIMTSHMMVEAWDKSMFLIGSNLFGFLYKIAEAVLTHFSRGFITRYVLV